MTPKGIPAEVRNFILKNFDSVELLEVLLLLRADKERAWTNHELNRQLRTDIVSIAIRTRTLVAKGFISSSKTDPEYFQYKPQSAEASELIDELAFYYEKWRVSVIELIFSRPRGTIQHFADAFKIRGE